MMVASKEWEKKKSLHGDLPREGFFSGKMSVEELWIFIPILFRRNENGIAMTAFQDLRRRDPAGTCSAFRTVVFNKRVRVSRVYVPVIGEFLYIQLVAVFLGLV